MLDALRNVPLFANTPDDQLRWVTEQGTEVWLSAGEMLVTEGDTADYWYVLLEGEVRITKAMADREALLPTFRRYKGRNSVFLRNDKFRTRHQGRRY